MRMRSWHLDGITDIVRYFLTNCPYWQMAAQRFQRPLSGWQKPCLRQRNKKQPLFWNFWHARVAAAFHPMPAVKTACFAICDSATKLTTTIYFTLKTRWMTGFIPCRKLANGNANGLALSYNMLQCKSVATPSQLNFNGHIFDLRSGKVNDQLVLDGAVRTRHGRQIGGVTFPGNQFNILQMAEIDQTLTF